MSQTREIKDYYEFIPHPDEDDGHWCLRLKEGKFKVEFTGEDKK